ncbi:12094_t:CDS:1 [Cetraspora pellucida]|uniref:12094_t:CDS:1 n=1 Tax=Cetraspora pellucida TaxID=1433469 RepID=A0ACA9NNX9_9GLOM|nr:12094_t:CDS:1 [Cetraspora pellucida]
MEQNVTNSRSAECHNFHGRFSHWLEGGPRKLNNLRKMVNERTTATHKCTRSTGSVERLKILLKSRNKKCKDYVRQHHHSHLSQQPGRHDIPPCKQDSRVNLDPRLREIDKDHSDSHLRKRKYDSRQSITISRQIRFGDSSEILSENESPTGTHGHRLIRKHNKHKAFRISYMEGHKQPSNNRRLSNTMEQIHRIHKSSLDIIEQGHIQDNPRQSPSSNSLPTMDISTLVPATQKDNSIRTSTGSHVGNSARTSFSDTSNTQSSLEDLRSMCLRNSLQSQRYSPTVLNLASSSLDPSASTTVSSHIRTWID